MVYKSPFEGVSFSRPKQDCLFPRKSAALEDACSSSCASPSSASKEEPAQAGSGSATVRAAMHVVGFQNSPSFPGRKVWSCTLTNILNPVVSLKPVACQKNDAFVLNRRRIWDYLHCCFPAHTHMCCTCPLGLLGSPM